MKTLIAFFKKEVMEQIRSKKLMILLLVFAFFGITNPVIAKLTPWLLELFSETMQDSGIGIVGTQVTALDSWMQYFGNLLLPLLVFALLQSNIFSKEYQTKTMTLILSKGFERYKVVLSKFAILVLSWTVCYLIYFATTFVGTMLLWEDSAVSNLFFAVFCWWLFGVFVISLFTLMSAKFESNGASLAISGGIVIGMYIISFLPKIIRFLPICLTDGISLVYGLKEVSYFIPGMIATICLTALLFAVSIVVFNKKRFK